MRWAQPGWLALLILLIAVGCIALLFRREGPLRFSSLKVLSSVNPGLRARLAFLPQALQILALVLAIVAMARPQAMNKKINRNVEGIDIMLALDVSDSMHIEDMQPKNRLESAKYVITQFVKRRFSDRIGLVIFAAEAYTRCPPTLDYDVLLKSLNTVTTDNIKQGTAIGLGLATAVARLKDSTAKSRVIILLTDGENNTGTIDPETATEIAKGYGIKIYTIGVGTNGEAQLPVYTRDAFGHQVKHYEPIDSTINEQLLQYMANQTGGEFFRVTDGDTLKKVFAKIDRLEKSKIETNQYVKYQELFPNWLRWAFLLYALQFILGRTVFRRLPA